MSDRISQSIEQTAARLSDNSTRDDLDGALAEVNNILRQSGNTYADQAALSSQLEQTGLLPQMLLTFATGNDADGSGINDDLDVNGDGRLEQGEIQSYLENISEESIAEAILAQALLDRFAQIETADNELYNMDAGIQDGVAGATAFEQYALNASSLQSNADSSLLIRNSDGLISEVIDASGNSRQFVYDVQGNIIQFTDSDNHIYRLENGNFHQYDTDGTTPTSLVVDAAELDRDGNLTVTNS